MVFSSIVQQELERGGQQRGTRLDLNAPLMSVRRQQRIHLQNLQQSTSGYGGDDEGREQRGGDSKEFSWESLRSPGAVPFVWERTPGRPKSGHIRSDRLAVACSSPAPPPGRTMTRGGACSPANAPLSTEAPSRKNSSVADLKANHRGAARRRKKKAPLLLLGPPGEDDLSSPPPASKHRQSSLAELLARKGRGTGACSSSSSDSTGVVSESELSESLMAPPDPPRGPPPGPPPPVRKPTIDDPGARDFILKRFLPAAKAMADESASSSPFSSPLLSANSNHQHTPRTAAALVSSSSPSTSSPRKQVSASVERIQTYQYKFASVRQQQLEEKKKADSSSNNEDVFSLRACGFFSFNLLRHLRPQYPSSRLKRASERANNRFASDDFRTSMLVKRVNGDLTIKHEGELSEAETEDDPPRSTRPQTRVIQGLLKSPRRLPDSPLKNQEHFYDCETNFEPAAEPRRAPRTPGRSYYRGSVSPLVEKNGETRGFLGLPENYKPPDDPYRSGGEYSPSIHQQQKSSGIGSSLERERNSSSLAMMNARNQSFLAQRLARNARINSNEGESSSSPGSDSRNGVVANLSWNSSSCYSNAGGDNWPEKNAATGHLLQSPARVAFPASPVSSLLPPKSPSQSWLWKALPLQTTEPKESSANWESTVKSRQLRPDHLRYSEENALESCQYYP